MEEKLRVLKVMSEITSRIDMTTFAQRVGLSTEQTAERLQDLVNSGLIKKLGGGYGITKRGQIILKISKPVPENKAFHFNMDFEQPAGFSARSIKDFYEIVKKVDSKALEFHLYRGDFEKWINYELKDNILANELSNLKKSSFKGKMLRSEILKVISTIYGL